MFLLKGILYNDSFQVFNLSLFHFRMAEKRKVDFDSHFDNTEKSPEEESKGGKKTKNSQNKNSQGKNFKNKNKKKFKN